MESMQELEGQHEPVSIVGMGCRWAGGVTSPTGLWELLRNNKDGWRKFDEPRFSAEGFHHPNQDRPGSLRTEGGFLVEEDARLFDNAFFGITAREVETMDPSQRKLLEVVYEAFENGGETWESISNSRTGVYIGSNSLDHTLIQARDWESPRSYAATGADASLLANRISYIFNLHGPSLAMNTACSSSMYALHMAVSAIRNGDCDGAIVAAANWITDPSLQSVLDKLGALSPTSRCHTFDASADGYARGEGFAAIYLKKSSIAVLEKMPIRAMIRGTAINANGRTGGITRSSTEGQEDVIRRAYENSGNLPFSDTAFFECHGTGTQAGDPIEVEAIGNVFASSRSKARKDRLLIGSVKPSLGHTEGASAIASIMKVVLSLEAGEVPPTFGVKDLNTHIDFEKARVEVVRDHTAQWPEGKLRRASINSFGFGGANGHCVIDHVNVVLPGYTKPGILARPAAAPRSATNPVNPVNPPSSPPRPSGIPKLQRSATIGTPIATAMNSTNGQANGQTSANSSGSSNAPAIGRQSSISRISRRKSRVLTKSDKSDKFETQSVSDKKKNASMDWVTSKLGSMFHSSNANSARPPTAGPNGASLNGDYFGSAALTSPAPVSGNSGMSSLTCPVRYNAGGPQKTMKADATTRQLVLLPFSAHNASSLKLNIDALSATSSRWPLADIAYTLGCKRSRLQQRTFRVVDKDDVASGLALEQRVFTSPDHASNLAFVFSGQGTQWHAMGAELFQYAAFRTVIAYLDQVLHAHAHPGRTSTTMWRIANVLSGACEPDCVQSPAVSQVVCTAVQIGVVDLLASWGVRPVAVVGHSAGEMAAAYASGRITAAEAITAAYFHGQAVAKNRKKGAMLAVGLGAGQVAPYLEGWEEQVQAAALNSPASVALSGDEDAIMALSNKLTEDGVFNRVLSTAGNAYHSRHMKALGNDYSAILLDGIDRIRKLGLLNPANRYRPVPWVSSVTPHKTMASDGQNLTAAYWRANLESPVRFTEAVTNMMALPLAGEKTIDVLIEIGPHPTLKGPLEQILKSAGKLVPYASTLQRNTRGMESVLSLAGTLFSLNAEIDMAAVNAMDEEPGRLSHGCTAIDLPKYQFSYGPISYYESRPSKEFRLRKVLRHDLLGSKLPGTSKLQPQWRNMLRLKDVPWLSDHRLIPDAVLPAAGFIAMAIEAATRVYQEIPDALQITGFSLRKLDIETALRLPEDDAGIEVMFSMTQVEGSTAKSPAWASFAISSVSRDSSEWTEHCTGTIRVDVAEPDAIEAMSTEMDARHPETRAWYNKFAEIGLGYGPTFQPLSDLRVDPYRGLAQANIKLNSSEGTMHGESKYLIHPAALDGAFQLGLIACYGGQVEKASTAFVPVHLSQMYVNAGLGREAAVAVAQGKIQGLRGAYIDLQLMDKGGRVALHVERLRCLGFKESKKSAKEIEAKKPFCSPFTRVAWKPDIRKLNNRQMRDLFVRGGDGPQPNGELQHWVAWLKHCGEEDQRPNMVHARRLSPEERHQLLGKLSEEVGDKPEVEAAKRLHKNIGDILTGHNSGIDVLVPGGLLNSLYDVGHVISGAFPQLANVMDCLGHTNPNMRVLEIGAGTGSATRVTMGALHGPNGIKRYGSYTFTDTSAGFLTSAQQGFMSGYRDVNYAVLDIEQDPLENGFEPVYDVIVACETIHATQSMDKTLAHCHRLLKPGGKLVLVENTRMRVLLTLLYGTLAGYWLGTNDGRTEGPFMNQETWDVFLRKAGFSGAELVLDDYERPTNTTSVIVSTKTADNVEQAGPAKDMNDMDGLITPATNGVVHLLLGTDRVQPPLLKTVAEEFEHRGIATKTTLLEDVLETVPAGARVVAFLCTEDNLLLGDEQRLKAFQYLAKTAESMVWLTSSGMVKGRNAVAGFMVGLMRTIATENPTGRFLSIDIDAENFEFAEADDADEQRFDLARGVVDQEISLYREGSSADDGEPKDRELAWQDGCMWVSRVVPDTGLGAYAEPIKTPSGCGYDMVSLGKLGPVRAAFETPGNLNSLYFRAYTEMMQPIPADHIEVRVRAVGLNWKDLGLSSGRFDADGSNLSSEYAGSITRVGSAVTNLAVGDRVYGIGRGHFGNFTCVPAAFAQKLRPTDKSVEMATMPLVYATAVYAFQYVARIRKGHKVLIQSATGGLGLAAIQVAQSKGGEIYCTVSSSEKKKFLVENGIPEDHIFSSRDTKALLRAAKQCGAKGGFDVILSTAVGGDSLHQAFKALAPMGHLVDVGRLDVLGSKELGLELFQKNANFSSFDLNLVLDNDPELGGELMEAVNDLYQVGFITPIHPVTCSDIAELDKTLVGFAKGVHIGKLVVSFQNPKSQVKVVREPKSMVFRPDARYVITGGLGGLGRGIIRWMVDRGARDFTVLSRRGLTTPEAHLLVKDLEARGVRIDCIMCDVSNREDALKAVSESSGQPIKGVVHAAMSLTDLTFDKLTIDQWRDGFAAKALGTVNLHEAVESLPLDFFVMVTSTESIWAPPAQAAYVAANNFQDYFARYRRNLGLPASTVSYGLVADVGSDFRDQTVGIEDMYARNRALVISEHQLLAQLEPAFLYSVPYKTVASQWIGKHTDPLSAANLYTCMDPAALAKLGTAAAAAANAPPPPRWYGDGRVALIMRAMEDSQRAAASGSETTPGAGKSAVAQLRDAFDQGVSAGPASRAKTVELVVHGIVRTVADMLFVDAASVNAAKSVAEHGVDSLLAAELKSWFGQALRANVSVERLLDAGLSIKSLAEEVVDRALKG
ncbi:Type I Iterative PKS [Apiospora kogelbergensis]|uniref:Type I Iterative PKS n=1 Tax=Apiospora kogelbergensis TaxID=1337665 RepID=UPI0031328350